MRDTTAPLDLDEWMIAEDFCSSPATSLGVWHWVLDGVNFLLKLLGGIKARKTADLSFRVLRRNPSPTSP